MKKQIKETGIKVTVTEDPFMKQTINEKGVKTEFTPFFQKLFGMKSGHGGFQPHDKKK